MTDAAAAAATIENGAALVSCTMLPAVTLEAQDIGPTPPNTARVVLSNVIVRYVTALYSAYSVVTIFAGGGWGAHTKATL